jgi:hypothetical protein
MTFNPQRLQKYRGLLIINMKINLLGVFIICLILSACSAASSIQRADNSKSGFDGAVYSGEETVVRDDIPDYEAYRIFHQGATGFVSVTSVRSSAEARAQKFCNDRGLRYELLRQRISVGAHIAGNFPRAELVFACVPKENDLSDSSSYGQPINRYDELRELKTLLDEGVITQSEFEQEKVKILEK